jgi:hypothetical protein
VRSHSKTELFAISEVISDDAYGAASGRVENTPKAFAKVVEFENTPKAFAKVVEFEIRRRRSLTPAQGSSAARTLGTNTNKVPTLKGFALRETLSGLIRAVGSDPGLSRFALQPWAGVSERLRRIFQLNHFSERLRRIFQTQPLRHFKLWPQS